MYQIDNQKFGEFITKLRKEKKLTQKELADKLFVSDKTVSKWERGLSMPNVSLLIPIAEILDVTVTELLKGEQIRNTIDIKEVEDLLTYSMDLTWKEQTKKRQWNKKWKIGYVVFLLIVFLELIIIKVSGGKLEEDFLILEGLSILFAGWFCLLAKETLPTYYDENKISYIIDGIFRMHICGLYFNNSNYPYILNIGRIWTLAGGVILPIGLYLFSIKGWYDMEKILALFILLGFFVPMYIVGKKYE